jgi:heat shock protein HslJ
MHRKHLLGLSLAFLFVIACTRDEAPEEPAAPVESAAPAEPAVPPEPAAPPEEATAPDLGTATPAEEPAIPAGDNSRNSLDWPGSYSGVLPCASCPGIETIITLREDGTFDRSTLYIDEAPAPETESGRFSWNAAGSAITLGSAAGQQYQVGEGALFQLDESGKRITELARRYVLEKHVQDPAIEDRRWKLVELRGNPVESAQGARTADLTLSSGDSVASGNSSCNSYSGGYAIKSGQRIRFARNMAVTMMACADMSIESAFLEALGQADNYTVGDDGTLSLNRARMAPLARFALDEGG